MQMEAGQKVWAEKKSLVFSIKDYLSIKITNLYNTKAISNYDKGIIQSSILRSNPWE